LLSLAGPLFAQPAVPTGQVRIIAQHSLLCLQAMPDASVQQQACSASNTAQLWNIMPAGTSYAVGFFVSTAAADGAQLKSVAGDWNIVWTQFGWQITATDTGRCLDITGGATAYAAGIQRFQIAAYVAPVTTVAIHYQVQDATMVATLPASCMPGTAVMLEVPESNAISLQPYLCGPDSIFHPYTE
jgi:hypothetical protein